MDYTCENCIMRDSYKCEDRTNNKKCLDFELDEATLNDEEQRMLSMMRQVMNEKVNDDVYQLLFEALAQILSNQQDILRHLGVSKYDSDYGWSDSGTSDLLSKCNSMACSYEHNDY